MILGRLFQSVFFTGVLIFIKTFQMLFLYGTILNVKHTFDWLPQTFYNRLI